MNYAEHQGGLLGTHRGARTSSSEPTAMASAVTSISTIPALYTTCWTGSLWELAVGDGEESCCGGDCAAFDDEPDAGLGTPFGALDLAQFGVDSQVTSVASVQEPRADCDSTASGTSSAADGDAGKP